MRLSRCVLLCVCGLGAAPWGWDQLPAPLQRLLTESGLSRGSYSRWQNQRAELTRERLALGAAEHIAYFVLQTQSLGKEPPLAPFAAARGYLQTLPPSERDAFLDGKAASAPMSDAVQRRMRSFWDSPPQGDRHRILRAMADSLGWQPEAIMQAAYRFLIRRSETEDADGLYQQRGLSADPFPASMRAVERGVMWLRSQSAGPWDRILLAGPGAELGSRFGLDDSQPVVSPQPAALLALLEKPPKEFACVDIRPEVVESLRLGPCRAERADVVADGLPEAKYDLAVATNLLVYLDDQELAVALANFARGLRPGGCLLHNDARFAARLFGEASGLPVRHFEAVSLGVRAGREQVDRIVIHCRPKAKP